MGIKYEPKPYQKIAADFMAEHKRCALFLAMGLGKTVVTLTRAKELIDNFEIDKALVIAPKRVAEDTWTREADKWEHLSGLRVAKVLGSAQNRIKALHKSADIYVINRENIPWLVEYYANKWPFDMVIIDESSSFKSPTAKRWRKLKQVIKLSEYVVELTGTPAANGYLDLWAQIYLIDGGEALGKTVSLYKGTYFNPGAHKGYIVYEWHLKPGAKERIDKKLSSICLSMSKEDWLSLPPITYNDIYVRMTPGERKTYEQMEREKILPLLNGKISELEDSSSAVVGETAAVLSGKLLQLANGAVYDTEGQVFHVHDQKLDALEELVDTSNGQPLLVFYSYIHDLDRIKERFPNAVELKSPDAISRWNDGEIEMLLAHPASAAYGLNLQEGGHIVVWFGLPWSLELYSQANARLHRQGQENPVIVHHLICENTLDSRVLSALTRKDTTQRALLEALKNYIGGNDGSNDLYARPLGAEDNTERTTEKEGNESGETQG